MNLNKYSGYPVIFIKLTFFLLVINNSVFAQSIEITGKISDSNNNGNLFSASILLYHLPDSTFKGTTSNGKGIFHFSKVKPGSYLLRVIYLGYKTIDTSIVVRNKSIDLGEIKLIPENKELKQVLVTDKVLMVSQSGDTTVFDAAAFKVNKDAVAQDLLLKIPGIQVSDGKVKAQGEEVKKVYVDGKTFFGDDPNMALKNIPADIIQKVQVFDEKSEQSQLSGYDDGTTSKAINILTSMNITRGTFGKLHTGYGSEQKYDAGGDIHLFNRDQRLSIIGQFNNTNEQNFSSFDMLGVMGRQGPGNIPGGSNNGSAGNSETENISSGNLVNSSGGNTIIKGSGFNYNNQWNDVSIDGSYFFNNTGNDLTALLNRNYFMSSSNGQNYVENSNSSSTNTNHIFNIRFNYKIDSLNEIRFIPSLSLQHNTSSASTNASTFQFANLLNTSNTLAESDLNGLSNSSLLIYRHKFNNTGRSLTFAVNANYNKSDGNKKQISENSYFKSVIETNSINQLTNILNSTFTIYSDLTYTEPINSDNSILLNIGHSVSHENNDKKTFSYYSLAECYSLLDTSLSNEYGKDYITNTIGTGYRYHHNKISLNANINYNIASLISEQTYPVKYQVERSFNSILPALIFRYNISRDMNLNFFYRTSNTVPSVSQLQNIVDNSNPLQLSIGNPELKQEYDQFATLRFSSMNYSNMNSFFIMVNGSLKNNYIGTNTIVAGKDTTLQNGIFLNPGSQFSTPQNIDGYISAQIFMAYGLPADLISSTININISANYVRTPGILNTIGYYLNSYSYSAGAVISSNISTDIDFLISSTTNYNIVKASVSSVNNDNYISQVTKLNLYCLLFDEFVLQGDFTHKYDGGLSKDYNPNTYLLNLSICAKFFSDNRAEFKFKVYDLLNQNTNISRLSTENYIQDYSTNVTGRYFLFSFNYKLSIFY